MRPAATVPDTARAEIVRLYVHERLPLKRIAERTYYSATTVGRVLHAENVPMRHAVRGMPRLSLDETLERTRLYGLGMSVAEVAETCGVSKNAIRQTLKRMGVKCRRRDEAQRLAHARGRRTP